MLNMKKLIIFLLIAVLAIALVSCGGGNSSDSVPTPDPTPNPDLLNFEGITFADLTVTYNGNEHVIEVSGNLPTGTKVTYTNNRATDAGEYSATARLECEGYNTKPLSAKLTVNKADITGITFNGDSVEYDTDEHSIYVVGNVPAGVVVTYTCGDSEFISASQVGEYEIVATLSGKNHNTLVLSATLKITSTESLLNVINFNDVIYFQNDLDGKKLYKIEDGKIEKVNNDVPECFFTDGNYL